MGIKFTAGRVTVDSVLKTISQSIDDLQTLKSQFITKRTATYDKIDKLEEEAKTYSNDIDRCDRVGVKLAELIS